MSQPASFSSTWSTSVVATTIFVEAPTFAELERRLRERATDSAGKIEERLAVARAQMDEARDFEHVVVNDDVERAVTELDEIVTSELSAVSERQVH